MHIQDTIIDPNSAISRYAFQMHFRCTSKMLKRFDAKLEMFQMRFVFTGLCPTHENDVKLLEGITFAYRNADLKLLNDDTIT